MKKKLWTMLLSLVLGVSVLPFAQVSAEEYEEEIVTVLEEESTEESAPVLMEEETTEEEVVEVLEEEEVLLEETVEENEVPEEAPAEENEVLDEAVVEEIEVLEEAAVEEIEVFEEMPVEEESGSSETGMEEYVYALIENADRSEDWKSIATLVLESMIEEDFEDLEGESDEAILLMFDTLITGETAPANASTPNYYVDGTTLVLTYGNGKPYDNSYSLDWDEKEKITLVIVEDEIEKEDFSYFFYGLSSVREIRGLENLNTEYAHSMRFMFSDCSSLTSLDLSGFHTENARYMDSMFQNCDGLTSLDLGSFDTSLVKDMSYLLANCSNLTSLNISSFRTDSATNMSSMFQNCAGLTTLDLSQFNTENVTNMWSMFAGCTNLTTLNVKNWNTEKVTYMWGMFSELNSLEELDLSNWTISSSATVDDMFQNFDTRGIITCPKAGGDRIKLNFTVVDEAGTSYTDLSSTTPVKIACLNNDQIVYDPSSDAAPVHGQLFIKGPYMYRFFEYGTQFKGWTVSFLERYRWNPCMLEESALLKEGYLSYGSYRTSEESAKTIQGLIQNYLDTNAPLTIAPALTATAQELHNESIISLAELFKVDNRYLNTSDYSTQYGGIRALASDFTVPVTADVTNMFFNAVYIEELPANFILPDRSDLRGLFANAVRLDPFMNGLIVSDAWRNTNSNLGLTFSFKGAIYATRYPSVADNKSEIDMFYNTGLLRGGLKVYNFTTNSLTVYSANDGSQGGASLGFARATELENVTTNFAHSEFHFNLNASVRYALLDNADLRSIKNLTVYDSAAGYFEKNTNGAVFTGNVELLNTPNLEVLDGLTCGGFDGGLLLNCTEALTDVRNIKIIPSAYEGVELTAESTRGLFSTTPNVRQIQIHVRQEGDTLIAVSPDLAEVNPDLTYDNEQWQWFLGETPILGATEKTLCLKDYDLDESKVEEIKVKYINSLMVGAAHFDMDGKLPEGFILNQGEETPAEGNSGIQTFMVIASASEHNRAYSILSASLIKDPEPEGEVSSADRRPIAQVEDTSDTKPQVDSITNTSTDKKEPVKSEAVKNEHKEEAETVVRTNVQKSSTHSAFTPNTSDSTQFLFYMLVFLASLCTLLYTGKRIKQ